MSADPSNADSLAIESDEANERRLGERWKGVAVMLACGTLAAAGAGWLGYRTQFATSSAAPSVLNSTQRQRMDEVQMGLPRPMSRSFEVTPTGRFEPPPSGRDAEGAKLSWPMWEFRLREPIPPRTPSLTPPTWRLIGSSLAAGKWSVIVLRQGKPDPEYFSVGQELPGGYRIVAIDDQDVTLAQGQRTLVLSYLGSR